MVRTIIHGARIGRERCPNGVQHTGIKFPSCWGGGGQGGQGLLVLLPRCKIFLVRTLRYVFFLDEVQKCIHEMLQTATANTRTGWSTPPALNKTNRVHFCQLCLCTETEPEGQVSMARKKI